jgi:CMP-2-keto-3-deoxyoctulosonic acid synthetase
MVLWVAELSAKAVGIENVYVATEDQRIADVVAAAGFNTVMTADSCLTGTDRLAEAAQHIELIFILTCKVTSLWLTLWTLNTLLSKSSIICLQ